MSLLRFICIGTLLSACVYHDSAPEIIDDGADDIPEPINFVCHIDSVTWSKTIRPIMISSCKRSNCHDGISRADFENYAVVRQNASAIKIRVRNRSMPFDGPPLSVAQIDSITCWVDKGSVEN